MSINGVNGSQGPQYESKPNQNNIQQQIKEYENSIFGQCDTDKSGKLEGKNKDKKMKLELLKI